ncbi:SIMPL domain-containing protein [Glaciihabitans sp. INWT7]|uniref:SIMPL domain-containing protein n=1 Tax=Glaciihabitans sp. INWT7 TaxID=2596912 RepID=UPI0016298738|nr:SIMPL domain-containing protein [Glaciihabitans sp. INWT7]QNE46322.1 SIMPL domain-containing protein [Glaciihabitans sp. INWT7]
MTDTIITVQGRFSSFYPPERATVQISVGFEGPVREPVFAKTVTVSATIRSLLAKQHSPATGPITWWSSDSIQVWSSRPWSQDGAQLPPVFHSRIGFSAKFSDFAVMAEWIERVAVLDGLTVGTITWALTEGRKTAVIAEVRSRAVKDAVAKASVYAQSIGLGSVRAVALADPGMLGDQVGASAGGAPHPMSRMMAAGSAPELSLTPEDIEIDAVVDARFIAS